MISFHDDLPNGNGENPRVGALKGIVSASRLTCWSQCRLKFYFRYGVCLRASGNSRSNTGRVVHRALQAWNLSRWRGLSFTREDLVKCFNAEWEKLPQASAELQRQENAKRARAFGVLEAYMQ